MAAGVDTDLLAQVKGLDRIFGRCVRAKDARALAEQFYTADARLLPPGQPECRGREQIAAFWQTMFENGLEDASIETDYARVSGDLGYATGTGAGRVEPEGLDVIPLEVKYVLILERQSDGGWLVSADIWNDDE